MHGKIIQLTKKEKKHSEWIKASDYYYGFVGRIADYARDIDEDERMECIDCMTLPNLRLPGIDVNTVTETLSIDRKREYFATKFSKWKRTLEELSLWKLEDFMRPYGSAMYEINMYYDDDFDVYVDDSGEWGGLMTFDEWMRSESVNDGDLFYIGGIVDYHF